MNKDVNTMPLLCPNILDYIKGREEVCKIVLSACQAKTVNVPAAITLHTYLFATLCFTPAEIIYIIQKSGQHLMIRFSYSLLLQVDDNYTVEDLATLLWKYMCRVVKCN